jgi:uncharacterized membrane protein (Fun14 family)
MIYFIIIVLLIMSFLSLVYLTYRQQEIRINSRRMKELTDNYNRQSRYLKRPAVRTLRSSMKS